MSASGPKASLVAQIHIPGIGTVGSFTNRQRESALWRAWLSFHCFTVGLRFFAVPFEDFLSFGGERRLRRTGTALVSHGQGLPWCRARCFHPFVSEAAASSFSSIGVCKKCVPEPDAVATVCPFHLPCTRTNDFPEMASKTDRAGRVVWVCWAYGRVRLGRKIGSNRG